jgi:hypothetical protein
VQLPQTIEWTVDGRRILVYPSSPVNYLDIGHHHLGAHVAVNQIHAQGPHHAYATDAAVGEVTGGVVYTVTGRTPGSEISIISEKVRIHNKTAGPLSLSLYGMGFKPLQPSLVVPDLTGLNITGTTVAYTQGNSNTLQLTYGPDFAPLKVLPVVSFSGFNPFHESIKLDPGAFLIMITELKVSPRLVKLGPVGLVLVGMVTVLGLMAAIGMLAWRRRSQRRTGPEIP